MLEEPIDKDILAAFYADPARLAFAAQTHFLTERYRLQMDAAFAPGPCVLDRTMPEDRVFARCNAQLGRFSPAEWRIYEKLYDVLSAVRPPMLLLYLKTTPEVLMDRVKHRGRPSEENITLDYLRQLHDEYARLMADIVEGRHHWSRGITVRQIEWDVFSEANQVYVDVVVDGWLKTEWPDWAEDSTGGWA